MTTMVIQKMIQRDLSNSEDSSEETEFSPVSWDESSGV